MHVIKEKNKNGEVGKGAKFINRIPVKLSDNLRQSFWQWQLKSNSMLCINVTR